MIRFSTLCRNVRLGPLIGSFVIGGILLLAIVMTPVVLRQPPPTLPAIEVGQWKSEVDELVGEPIDTMKGDYHEATHPLYCNRLYCYTLVVVYRRPACFDINLINQMDDGRFEVENLVVGYYKYFLGTANGELYHRYGFNSVDCGYTFN